MASANMTLTLRASNSSPGKNSDIDVVVLNFHEHPKDIKLPTRFAKKFDFKMLLSSGDWVVNGITNIDNNPEYDIHVCLPEPASTTKNDTVDPLQANIDSILGNPDFKQTKLICYVDYTNPVEISEFCRVFMHRISQLGTLDNRILPNTNQILELLAASGRVIWNLASKMNANILADHFTPVGSIMHKTKHDYVKIPQPQSNSSLEGANNSNKKTNISRKKSGNKNANLAHNNKNSVKKPATNKNRK
jgi:hypothetical protein